MAVIHIQNQFHLRTEHTSYIFSIYQEKFPVHHYWGERLDDRLRLEYQAESVCINRPAAIHIRLREDKWVFEPDLRKEFSAAGKGDYRVPTVHARYGDGSTVADFKYCGYEIYHGKKDLDGLPCVYAEEGDRADTLEITMLDERTGLKAVLGYTVWEEYDIITRNIRYVNEGGTDIHLLAAMSMCVDFPAKPMQYIQFPGDWARERYVECCDVRHGIVSIESRRGFGGHSCNPFLVMKEPHTTQDRGEAFGFALVYSGNFVFQVEKAQVGTIRVSGGLNSFDFDWYLKPGEALQTPEVVMACSDSGLNGMSRLFHRIFRERLIPARYRNRLRPVVINNWEGTGPHFTQEQLVSIMDVGAQVGAELFVLDDGWFGKYDNGTDSCGDWYCNRTKLPDGLGYLSRQAKERGLKFGLWFEPEMMAQKSDLYREHRDWSLHVKGGESAPVYGRFILDLSRQEVRDYLIKGIGDVIREAGLDYIKWDCNRNITETQDQMQAHRYMLGFYQVLETLTAQFPEVLFEGCSSGGGRFDAGMLPFMPQSWTSDMARPYSRLYIQHGTSYGYPPVCMTAHIGAMEVGMEKWNPYLHFYALVAMGGNFGLEMDLRLLSESEKDQVRGYVETYKEIRPTVQNGDFYRLESPFDGPNTTWEFVSRDRKEAVVLAFQTCAGNNVEQHMVFLKGLEPGKRYVRAYGSWQERADRELSGDLPGGCDGEWDGIGMRMKFYTGEELMKAGLYLASSREDYNAELLIFREVLEE